MKEIKKCDVCGDDATERFPCRKCRKDLCINHQILVSVDSITSWKVESATVTSKSVNISGGVYCKSCLIGVITENFPNSVQEINE